MAKKELMRKVWRWTRRGLLGLLVLFVVSAIGFELWRQNEISNADGAVSDAVREIQAQFPDAPPYSQWIDDLGKGTNGGEHFVSDYIEACHARGMSSNSPTHSINWHGWNESGNEGESTDQSELSQWLVETDAFAEALAGLQEFDHIMLDWDHPALWYSPPGGMSSHMFSALIHLTVPADRVAAHVHLGQVDAATKEFLVICNVAQLLRNAGSPTQLLFLTAFTNMARELQWRLAADNLLTQEDLNIAQQIDPDAQHEIAVCCKATLHWTVETATQSAQNPGSAWFGWLNPFNYDRWSDKELIELTLLYQYKHRALAEWIHFSLRWLNANDGAQPLPPQPDSGSLLSNLILWNDQLKNLRGKEPVRRRNSLIVDMRRAQLAGSGLEDLMHLSKSDEFVEVEWDGPICILRYRHTESVWKALGGQEHEWFPEEEEFYADWPPVSLSFK